MRHNAIEQILCNERANRTRPCLAAHAQTLFLYKHANNNNKMAAYISEEIENESETLALSMSASPISKLKRVGIPAVTAAAKKRRILQRFKPEYGLVLGSDRRSELSPLIFESIHEHDNALRILLKLMCRDLKKRQLPGLHPGPLTREGHAPP